MKKLILASLLALVFSGCSIFSKAPTNMPTNKQIKQCEAGDGKICDEIGKLYRFQWQKTLDAKNEQPSYKEKAKQFYLKACEFKDGGGCYHMATISKGKEAINYYKKACDLYSELGCIKVAKAYKYGNDGLKQDLQKAQEYYKKSGNEFWYKYNGFKDYLEKLPSYEKSCESNDAESCLEAGRIHSKSDFIKGYKINAQLRYDKAVALLEQNCKRGNNAACIRVSELYLNDSAVKDLSKAAASLELVCKRGDNAACFDLGILYSKPYEKITNLPKAVEFFDKACKRGDNKACYNLAICYNEGKGVQINLSKAKQYYHKACNVGIEEACKKLMVITNMGIQ